MRLLPSVLLLSFFASILAASTVRAAAPKEPGAAAFEGAIDLKITMEAGGGDLRLWMAGERARLDMALTINPLPAPLNMSVLLDAREPRKATLVNDAMKSYSVIDLAEAGAGADSAAGKYALKEIGKEKILGYVCNHVTLTRPGELVDAWITQELPDVYRVLRKLQQANPQYGAPDAFRALDAAGKAGMPMRIIVVRDGQRVTTEARKIERRAVAASRFSVPADYARSDFAGTPQPTPAQIEEMRKMIQGALQGQ